MSVANHLHLAEPVNVISLSLSLSLYANINIYIYLLRAHTQLSAVIAGQYWLHVRNEATSVDAVLKWRRTILERQRKQDTLKALLKAFLLLKCLKYDWGRTWSGQNMFSMDPCPYSCDKLSCSVHMHFSYLVTTNLTMFSRPTANPSRGPLICAVKAQTTNR